MQRDWLLDPQSLSFAPRIKTHALVSLIQKGLQYHQVEQSVKQVSGRCCARPFQYFSMFSDFGQPGNRNTSSAATFYFGADPVRASSLPDRDHSDDTARESPQQRKHARESTVNGLGLDMPTQTPAAKRSRRSNGNDGASNGDRVTQNDMQIDNQNGYQYPNGPPEPVSPTNYSPVEDGHDPNGMDIDEEADAPGSPSPNDQLIVTLTHGESRGVQSEKVAELGPQSSILTVPDKTHVEHTAWNPKDPTILAVGGEALCRLWHIPRTAAFSDNSAGQQSFVDLLDPSYASLVTTMAWSPNGEVLAVATRDDQSDWVGAVCLWSKAGKALDELPAAQDMVLTLRWSPTGNQLLGITSSGADTSSLTLWDTQTSQAMPPYQLSDIVTDAAWTSNFQLTVCGHDIIASSLLENGKIFTLNHRPEPQAHQTWTHICYDSRTHTTALAAEESGVLGLIDSSDTLRITTAHRAEITALAYQPVVNLSAYPTSMPRLLATSSLDGTIKIWDAKRPFTTVHTLPLGYAAPAMAMSFTPDGYLVAAANGNRILIWSAEAGGVPKASWKGLLGKLPNGALTNGDGVNADGMDEGLGEPNPSLSWDAEGKKLALGVGNQVMTHAPFYGRSFLD